MTIRKVACMTAAGFLGVMLVTATATPASGKPPIVVEGQRIDPALQRRVPYGDLNLAWAADQKVLRGRISRTAHDLCFDVNGAGSDGSCARYAIRGTKDQVADAITRAKLRMAGLPSGPDVAISMVITAH